jgi:hypothetical protein
VFEGRATIGYDHGYDAQKFYLGLTLDPEYVEGFVEGCLERISEDAPHGEYVRVNGRTETTGTSRPLLWLPGWLPVLL